MLDGDGVIRVRGRIRKANLPCTLKNPVIITKSSHITSLIISHVHERTHYSGRGIHLNEFRSSRYWIVGGNAIVRQFISKCVTCLHLRGSQGEQKMAHLPITRIEPAPPFPIVGLTSLALACPTGKSCREEIWGLVYLLSEQSSTHRTGGFLGNGFVY